MPVAKQCVVCRKEFHVPPVRAESAKTCSRECRGVLIAQSYQSQRVSHRCKWCDTEFFSPKCHADRRTYCSTKCAHEAIVGNYAGALAVDGGTSLHSEGYVLERDREHPFAVKGVVMQHRLVMERWMREAAPDHHFLAEIDGEKYLRREIHVHHRNESKADNARGNLLACTAATHKDIHSGRPVMRTTSWPETGDEIEPERRTFTRHCLICGTTFKTSRSILLRGHGKYCSKSCGAKSRAGKPRSKRNAAP